MNNNKNNKSPYGPYKNANAYKHMGVVVLGFENVTVNGRPQIYAVGFDLDKPDQKVAISLMQEEGYRKNLAQVHFKLAEKTDGETVRYFNTNSGKEVTKEFYEDFLYNNTEMEAKYSNLVRQRSTAETLLSKRSRINALPAVLMFDNANKLGQLDDMQIYEARWVSGISGNTATIENDMEVERAFTVTHRKVLGNIYIKYNPEGQATHGDLTAIDRVSNLKLPHPGMTAEAQEDIALYNRDLLAHVLSNVTKSPNGYMVERKPYVMFNLMEKDGKHKETVRIYNEEYLDKRYDAGDATRKHEFMRPKSGSETFEAYMYHQDRLTIGLDSHLRAGGDITINQGQDLMNAYKADKTRAVMCSMLNVRFNPIITPELAERADPGMKAEVAIKANSLKSLHRNLTSGQYDVRLVSGTTFNIGKQYLQRLVSEMQTTEDNKYRPIRGLVTTEPFPKELVQRNNLKNRERVVGHDKDHNLLFSEMYICPTMYDPTAKNSSLYVSLITTPHQSVKAAIDNRIKHVDLVEAHSPSSTSYRFIGLDYKDYLNGVKETPSIRALIDEKQNHIKTVEQTAENEKEYRETYRVLGVHTPPAPAAPVQEAKRDKDKKAEVSLSNTDFGI